MSMSCTIGVIIVPLYAASEHTYIYLYIGIHSCSDNNTGLILTLILSVIHDGMRKCLDVVLSDF